MKRTLGGTPAGQGATYAWEGNNKAGAGRMEIMEAAVPSKVTIKLEFSKPFVARNTAEFTLVPEGAATTVTWAMRDPYEIHTVTFTNGEKPCGACSRK